jgi:hypothetical protein
MAWQRFRVQLKGEAAPLEVQTSARDWAGLVMDPEQPRAIAMTFEVVHAALLRAGADVPRDYDSFLDVLDGIPEAIDAEDPTMLDPTPREP